VAAAGCAGACTAASCAGYGALLAAACCLTRRSLRLRAALRPTPPCVTRAASCLATLWTRTWRTSGARCCSSRSSSHPRGSEAAWRRLPRPSAAKPTLPRQG
jgi:hypothetical protein